MPAHAIALLVLAALWTVFIILLPRIPEEPRNGTGEDLQQDDDDRAGGLEHVPVAA